MWTRSSEGNHSAPQHPWHVRTSPLDASSEVSLALGSGLEEGKWCGVFLLRATVMSHSDAWVLVTSPHSSWAGSLSPHSTVPWQELACSHPGATTLRKKASSCLILQIKPMCPDELVLSSSHIPVLPGFWRRHNGGSPGQADSSGLRPWH